jgi:hypothetical protein
MRSPTAEEAFEKGRLWAPHPHISAAPAKAPNMATAAYSAFIHDPEVLIRMYVYFVNHRTREMSDPLSHTLTLMATSPVQLTFCESGLLPFRTTELPVFPFTDMTSEHRAALFDILTLVPPHQISENTFGCGKMSVHASLGNTGVVLDRLTLLKAFIKAVREHSNIPNPTGDVLERFCRVILQRFLSSVSLPSSVASELMEWIDTSAHKPE